MIKTFIFVEDGSVDLDELKSSVGDDVLVISYRQGATPPAIQQPREPVSRRVTMDKQKEIKKMAKAIYETGVAIDGTDIAFGLIDDSHFERMARKLVAEGYGDVRAAVKEFAESVKMAFYYEFDELIPSTMADKIDEIVKGVCGDE